MITIKYLFNFSQQKTHTFNSYVKNKIILNNYHNYQTSYLKFYVQTLK